MSGPDDRRLVRRDPEVVTHISGLVRYGIQLLDEEITIYAASDKKN
jgi:hypothetical protein